MTDAAPLPLGAVVDALATVAATTKRSTKRDTIAALLAATTPRDLPTVIGILVGTPRQGRIGIGWAAVRDLEGGRRAGEPLTIADVDAAVDALAATSGPGSKARRHQLLELKVRTRNA